MTEHRRPLKDFLKLPGPNKTAAWEIILERREEEEAARFPVLV